MKKKKKNRKYTNEGFNVEEILNVLRKILDYLEKVFTKLYPLLKKILLMEETKFYHENGTFRDLIQLLDNISREYKALLFLVISSEIIKDNPKI